MTTSVHFVYRCTHVLELCDELVPSWILKEYLGTVDFDPNTWQDVTHDYGSLPVDDECANCKKEAAKKRSAANGSTKGGGSSSAAESPSDSTTQMSGEENAR